MKRFFDYDPDTGVLKWRKRPVSDFPSAHAWNVWNGQNAGRQVTQDQVRIKGKSHRTARVIWYIVHGHYPKHLIDFQNGDNSDFRLENLVLRKLAEIAQTRKIQSNNKSGVKGVYFCKQREKWRAHIEFNGRKYALGDFEKKEGAVLARKMGERQFFGTGGGNRTHNSFRKPDFESGASTNSATPAKNESGTHN